MQHSDPPMAADTKQAATISVHAHHISTTRTMLSVLLALLALTALTVYTAIHVHLGGPGNLIVAILIACLKATLVVGFFMHLFYDKAFNAVCLVFCLIAAATFLMFTVIDLGSRDWVDPIRSQMVAVPDMAQKARLDNPVVAAGHKLFLGTCASCHGPEAKGLPGLGKNMYESEFIATTSDADLLKFIKHGRDPSEPMNTTGVAMPPRGGNPTLNDEDLKQIIAFIRMLRPYRGEEVEGADSSH